MDKHAVAIYGTGNNICYICLNIVLYTINSYIYRPNMWSKGWPKRVAVCCVC